MRARLASRLIALLLGAVLLLAAPSAARAQDDAGEQTEHDRIEALRELPREEQLRLRAALERFKSLPPEERMRLRERAREVGPDRLRELARRDVRALRHKHDALAREQRAVLELLGGQARLQGLSEVERRYMRALAVRTFQRHVKRRLMNIPGPKAFEDFQRLAPHRRAQRAREAMDRALERLFAELPPQRQAEIRALAPQEQRRARRELVNEFRMRETIEFARGFDALTLSPFLQKTPEERRQEAQRWAERERWYEMRTVLERRLHVPRETLRLMRGMRADEWARVRDIYERTEGLPPDQRRLKLEEEIRSLYGKGALDDRGKRRRERRRRNRDEN